MRIVDQFPRKVREIPTLWIPLPDGTRLAARVWLPEDAEAHPVPAILEYLPYRRRDGTTTLRDGGIHGYFAGHGYAGVRVDLRGTGDSDGIFRDEYLPEEQEDAAAVIAWLARQPWCDGNVGMMGISWGGFNALQVAARRPPALKAILTLCSTDDRYADDTHFMGGTLLLGNLNWASVMLAYCSLPPDPAVVGERWRQMWQQRLETAPLLAALWAGHARRDGYWQQGSVCEDWGAIQCPVFAVGGWADAYTNAIPRLLANLKAPTKALIGPWGHAWPQFGKPGPQIGFLQEALRWWDHWLKGIDTGIMAEPRLLAWLQDSQPPATAYETWPGRWIQADGWPPAGREIRSWPLATGRLGVAADAALPLASPQGLGSASGAWCPYDSDLPADQRSDDAGSLVFDSAPLDQPLALLGAPVAVLDVSADRPLAALAVRLCDVAPDGASTRVSYGLLNLAHRDGHEAPQPLEPGRRYRIRVQLNDLGHVFAAGRRVRLAASSAYWPTMWPQPDAATVTVHTGASRLELPVLSHPVPAAKSFAEPEQAPPVAHAITRPGDRSRRVTVDPDTGETVVTAMKDQGATHFRDIDLTIDKAGVEIYRIRDHDPLTAEGEMRWAARLERPGWRIRTETGTLMTATRDHFLITATLDAYHDDRRIFARTWTETVPRDFA